MKKCCENNVILFKQRKLLFKKQYQTAPNKQKKDQEQRHLLNGSFIVKDWLLQLTLYIPSRFSGKSRKHQLQSTAYSQKQSSQKQEFVNTIYGC